MGRHNKQGTGGLSFKTLLRAYMDSLPPKELLHFYDGLYTKALSGDVAAIKLMAELNDEFKTNNLQIDSAAKVVVMVPQIATDDESKVD